MEYIIDEIYGIYVIYVIYEIYGIYDIYATHLIYAIHFRSNVSDRADLRAELCDMNALVLIMITFSTIDDESIVYNFTFHRSRRTKFTEE